MLEAVENYLDMEAREIFWTQVILEQDRELPTHVQMRIGVGHGHQRSLAAKIRKAIATPP